MRYNRLDLVNRIATDPRVQGLKKTEINAVLTAAFELLPDMLQTESDRLLIPGMGTFYVHVTGRRIPGEDTPHTKYWRKFTFSANRRRIP